MLNRLVHCTFLKFDGSKRNKQLAEKLKDEFGSASVEFVLLAIPLFLPILLFLGQFENLSNAELVARTLARESLRAYVTSDNALVASNRAHQVLLNGARAQGLKESEIENLDLSFECSMSPCLSPGGRIRATVKFKLPDAKTVTAKAEELVSPWQWNGIYSHL